MTAWQETLFAAVDERPDLSFAGLVRHQLDDKSWVDVVPGWLNGHGELFDRLLAEAPWQHRQRWLYEHKVDEPRLVAVFDFPLPARLEQIRAVLSERYGVEFDSVLVNLYRDGRDSVAWHGDTVRKQLVNPVVATVSLGERRRFQLRRRGGGPTALSLQPGEGDLVVMGGACQHDWEHTVPKVRSAGARMSVTLRHSRAVGDLPATGDAAPVLGDAG